MHNKVSHLFSCFKPLVSRKFNSRLMRRLKHWCILLKWSQTVSLLLCHHYYVVQRGEFFKMKITQKSYKLPRYFVSRILPSLIIKNITPRLRWDSISRKINKTRKRKQLVLHPQGQQHVVHHSRICICSYFTW